MHHALQVQRQTLFGLGADAYIVLHTTRLSLKGRIGGLDLARCQSTGETELGGDALDTAGRVEVLDDDDLEAGGGALARGDGGVGEE